MLAIVTGAGSGIGREIARYLGTLRYELILVGRNEERLTELKAELEQSLVRAEVFTADLSDRAECWRLYAETRERKIDFLVNCAGLGNYGRFADTDLETDLRVIDVNVTALHILTKLFLQEMIRNGNGVILNVGSAAGFMAGPFFAGYYASKNYAVRLTEAIYEELRAAGSPVKIAVLCPGPVETDFDRNAGVKKSMKGLDPARAAREGVDGALDGKMLIVPGGKMRAALIATRLMGEKLSVRVTGMIQRRKGQTDPALRKVRSRKGESDG